jgi:hypothetical protein
MRNLVVLGLSVALAGAMSVAADDTSYGGGVTLEKATPIATLLASPGDYVGQKVRVEGVITGVCKKRGCWMQMTDPESGEGVRIKVEDGVIVFPYTAMGKTASAEGVFDSIEVEPAADEGAAEVDHAEHAGSGEAEGENCDKTAEGKKAGCDAPKKGNTIYLINGTGAVIHA